MSGYQPVVFASKTETRAGSPRHKSTFPIRASTQSRYGESMDGAVATRARKRAFDIDIMMSRLARAAKPFPKAMLFQLQDDGHGSVFEILVACILSIRTFEETSYPAARALFELAPTPADIARLGADQILPAIRLCTFPEPKARDIHAIAQRTVEEFNGQFPCDYETLLTFRGVGPKCASLAIGIACGKPPGVPVDSHVHQITNRWGYVATNSPTQTAKALNAKLPKKYWLRINRDSVPFGKNICTPVSPKCSICPLLDMCRQVGVTKHR
jgi:endonuclease III